MKTDNSEVSVLHEWGGLATLSPRLAAALRDLDAARHGDMPVVLMGDAGGELWRFAAALHSAAGRRPDRFVRASCRALHAAGLHEMLLGPQDRASAGALARARGGTLVLDHVDELSGSCQQELAGLLAPILATPLLPASEVRRRRLGRPQIVATAALDLPDRVHQRRFAAELFFRLGVFRVRIPPLRARRRDVPLVARRILAARHAALGLSGMPLQLGMEAEVLLRSARLSGDELELGAVLEQAASRCQGRVIESADLEDLVGSAAQRQELTIPIGIPLAEVERQVVAATLAANGGNKKRAAKQLGIARRTLYLRLARGGALDAAPAEALS